MNRLLGCGRAAGCGEPEGGEQGDEQCSANQRCIPHVDPLRVGRACGRLSSVATAAPDRRESPIFEQASVKTWLMQRKQIRLTKPDRFAVRYGPPVVAAGAA
jgi:hypothetical protein